MKTMLRALETACYAALVGFMAWAAWLLWHLRPGESFLVR